MEVGTVDIIDDLEEKKKGRPGLTGGSNSSNGGNNGGGGGGDDSGGEPPKLRQRFNAQKLRILTFFLLVAIMLLPVSLAPYVFGREGIVFLGGAAILGLWFLYASVNAARAKTTEKARTLVVVSIIYLPLLFLLMVADKR